MKSQSLLYTAYAARTIKAKLDKGYSFHWFEIDGRKITSVQVQGEKVFINGKEESDAEILFMVIERIVKGEELGLSA